MTLGLAGKNFESTSSLCTDGLLVNLDDMGCESLYIGETTHGVHKVRCVFAEENDDFDLTAWHFLVISHELNSVISSDHVLVCEDNYIQIYMSKSINIR